MEPLANKIRPQSLNDFVGQEHLVGEGKPLRQAMEQQHLFSFILWGPPGVGKTTLARIYAKALDADFFELSAVNAGKEDIKKIITNSQSPISKKNKLPRAISAYELPSAFAGDRFKNRHPHLTSPIKGEELDQQTTRRSLSPERGQNGKPKILFLDEIHRFNKAQQDFLLPYVETGQLTLIGATTENPSFEVIPALLSRCRVFVLNELSDEEMDKIITMAINNLSAPSDALGGISPQKERTLQTVAAVFPPLMRGGIKGEVVPEEARAWLISMANGDARQALTMMENTLELYGGITIDNLKNTLQSKFLRYDKQGEEHYNIISAFIKSMRAGQPDAALYYLARMVEGGEDPLFIARRMVIFASEDVGLAQPTALVVANAVFAACQTIGYPECAINLAHGAAYLAQCKKNRSAYEALRAAQKDANDYGNLPVPLKIRNAPTKLMKDLGYGETYEKYDADDYLPEELKGKKYF